MLRTAKIVSEVYGGKFPIEKSLLEKLPGVWPYTARAILAFAYSEPYLAWDTNLEKVFSRYYHGDKNIKLNEEEKAKIEEDFRNFITSADSLGWGFGGSNDVRAINNALMDFAATVDLKNPNHIDWEVYPLKSGRWYETQWSLEPREVKKSVSFPIPDATVIVILHEDHTVYYSTDDRIYSPYSLPPSLHRNTREYVQSYFREHYDLELSVRPVHKKWISKDGKPYIAVNAQIQAGKQSFREYTKTEAKPVLETLW
jgi:A/G-specific adenine glycosylase